MACARLCTCSLPYQIGDVFLDVFTLMHQLMSDLAVGAPSSSTSRSTSRSRSVSGSTSAGAGRAWKWSAAQPVRLPPAAAGRRSVRQAVPLRPASKASSAGPHPGRAGHSLRLGQHQAGPTQPSGAVIPCSSRPGPAPAGSPARCANACWPQPPPAAAQQEQARGEPCLVG